MKKTMLQTFFQGLDFFGRTRKYRAQDRSLHVVNKAGSCPSPSGSAEAAQICSGQICEDLSTELTPLSRKKTALKIGLDIHGVIDAFPEKFKLLSQAFFRDGAEVHIVTGVKRDASIDQLLANAGIQFTHYYSIVDYLEKQQETVEWIDGLPYADETQWNRAKRDYCEREGLDFMLDDSAVYRETFHDIDCTFLHVIGPQMNETEARADGKRAIPIAV